MKLAQNLQIVHQLPANAHVMQISLVVHAIVVPPNIIIIRIV